MLIYVSEVCYRGPDRSVSIVGEVFDVGVHTFRIIKDKVTFEDYHFGFNYVIGKSVFPAPAATDAVALDDSILPSAFGTVT